MHEDNVRAAQVCFSPGPLAHVTPSHYQTIFLSLQVRWMTSTKHLPLRLLNLLLLPPQPAVVQKRSVCCLCTFV